MLLLLALYSVQSRTMPLGIEGGTLAGVRLRMESHPLSSATQFGRIQVATWHGTSVLDPEELASRISGWTRTPTSSMISFERIQKNVKQTLYIAKGGRAFGGPGVASKELPTGIIVTEFPPDDGTIPPDWPRNFKRGIFRVLPDMVRIVKGKEPFRVIATQNPAGEGAEASYKIAISPKAARPDLQQQFSGWETDGDDSSFTVHEPYGRPPVYSQNRELQSVSVREDGDGAIVDVRWKPGVADRTALGENYANALVARLPKSKIPTCLSTDFRKRLCRTATSRPSYFVHRWEYSVQISMEDLLNELTAAKIGSGLAGPSLLINLSTKQTQSYLQVFEGRVVVKKGIPSGYKATPDIGKNFVDYVVQDLDRFVHVVLSESKSAGPGGRT